MPFPIAAVAAGTLGPLIATALRYLFLANIAAFVARLFGVLGIAFLTNEYLLNPILDMIMSDMAGIPGDLAKWMRFFGFHTVVSILASAYTILSIKKVVLGKRA